MNRHARRSLTVVSFVLAVLAGTPVFRTLDGVSAHEAAPAGITLDPGRARWPIAREPSGSWGIVGEAIVRNDGTHAIQIRTLRFTILTARGRTLLDSVSDTPQEIGAVVKVHRRDASGVETWQPDTVINPGEVGAAFLAELTQPDPLPAEARVTMQFSNGREKSFAVALDVFDPGQRMGWPASLDAEPWIAFNTVASEFHRVGSAVPSPGRLFVGQRFALDLAQVDSNGSTHPEWAQGKQDYYAWGEEVRSTGRGEVVAVMERERDLEIGEAPSPTVNPAGNYVVVRHGARMFSVYAHLQQGSVMVRTGDHVERGQPLGLVGNSGSSTQPHLHVHFTDAWVRAADPFLSLVQSQGLPALFWGAQVLRDGQLLPLKGSTPFEFDVIVGRRTTFVAHAHACVDWYARIVSVTCLHQRL